MTTQLTINKITEIYCAADDFCKEFSKEIKKHQILPNEGIKELLYRVSLNIGDPRFIN
ncbi:MAG: hypothetical protein LBL90_03980 [Prevotellaceae bacterium]|jgi:hypothetical protein|nr:hypothetical protein [Prevotellaceae bacterium]